MYRVITQYKLLSILKVYDRRYNLRNFRVGSLQYDTNECNEIMTVAVK